jgi:hypothetical protein
MAAPDSARWVIAVLVAPLLALFVPTLRRDPKGRFFALVMLLCIAPLMTTLPQDRVLFAASLGGSGLLACALGSIAERTSRLQRGALRVVFALHLVLAPLMFPGAVVSFANLERGAQTLAAALPSERGKDVILVQSPMEILTLYATVLRTQAHGEDHGTLHALYAGHASLVVARLDAHTLELTAIPGYCDRRIERIFTSDQWRAVPGERRRVGPIDVTILDTNAEARPFRVRFAFEEPLESRRYAFMVWEERRPLPWTPPKVGQRAELPGLPLVTSLPQ